MGRLSSPTSMGGSRQAGGPRGHPVLGMMQEMQRDRTGFLTRTAREWGDVCRYRLVHKTIYQVNHPVGIKRILVDNHRNYYKGEFFDVFRNLLGDGLFTSEGKHWLRQRRLMQPMFHKQHVAGFLDLIAEAAEGFATRLERPAAEGRTLPLFDSIAQLTRAIAVESLLGVRISTEQARLGQALDVVFDEIPFRFESPLYPPLWVPTSRNRRYQQELAVLHAAIQDIIAERRKNGFDGKTDLIQLLLETRDEETGAEMNPTQVQDEVMTLYVAGHETSATTLCWAMILLAQHPWAEERLHAELEESLAGGRPTIESLARLPFTRNVIQETLRLYPPAWVTNRSARAADEVCGYTIPAGSLVNISPYVAHHDPRWWDEPEQFNPDRFLAPAGDRPQYAYFPFGGGPRQCIGTGFAQLEIQVVLATLAQRFRFRLPVQEPVQPRVSTTLRPPASLTMRFEGR